MADIRPLTAADFDAKIALSQFAFQYEIPAADYERERGRFRADWAYGLFGEDGRMLSALSVIPFEAWIRGRKIKMGGIGGVSSWPDARRQGGVKRLMLHALDVMRANGQTLSMLAPFSFAFYRKFGYEFTIERKQYTLEMKQLPPRTETPGGVRLVEKDAAVLRPMYEEFASRYDGTLSRDDEWWKRVLDKPGMAAVYYNRDGAGEGYMLYTVKDHFMKVLEWVAVTEEARVALWSYAGNHDSMAGKLSITVPADDPLPFLLPDPRIQQELVPFFMSRIVDAEAFVKQYPFQPADRAEEWTLTIEDENAEWNRGTFRLRIEADGSARLERVPPEDAAAAEGRGLVCDIGALTAMLAGGRRAGLLHRSGRLTGEGKAVATLERRVPEQHPYLADFF